MPADIKMLTGLARREAMDKRNAQRRRDYRNHTGEYKGEPMIRVLNRLQEVLDTEADDFLYGTEFDRSLTRSVDE